MKNGYSIGTKNALAHRLFPTQRRKGQLLIELLLAVGISAILLPSLITGLVISREGKPQQQQRLQAVALLKEAEDAVRSIRDANWSAFAVNGTFHPAISGSSWSLMSGSETVNGFTRQVAINDVYRATSSGQIVQPPSSGYLDPSTKQVTVTVSWGFPLATSVSSTNYLTRHDNVSSTQTTQTDFNAGAKTNVAVVTTSGSATPNDGQIQLGAGGGGGDWCVPSLSITSVDLSRQGVPTAIAAYPGNIVTGTGGNASGPTFVKTTVSGNNPPTATIVGQYNNSKANGVFTETTYGYIATTSNSQEIQILDLNTTSGNPPTYSLLGWFDAPGNAQGNSVFATSNVGYMTDGNKFYTFDLSSHTGSRPQLNMTTVTLAGTGNKVVVLGNYAYVAVNSTTTQLQVIDVTDPKNPSIVASANLGNSQPGMDVSVNSTGTRAYVITSYASSTQPDFFIIDTSTKSGTLPKIGSGFNTNGMSPKGVSITTGNRALIVGTGGTQQYQVVNISNESSPASCAGLAIANGAYAVTSVLQSDGYAYSYVVTGDSNAELKVILGGAGGQYITSGTFESAPFNAGVSSVFNKFSATVSQPNQTSIKLQVAVANASSSSCSGVSYTYLGPNGDPGQYFTPGTDPTTIQDLIPIIATGNYVNPGQCFRYKVWLTSSDSTATPVLYDMTVNYSP